MARYSISTGISLLLLTWAWASHPVAAKDAVSFTGKTVTMTIGNPAGGRTDNYGRALGQSLVTHLPGKPGLVVINQPGAAGIVALNTWVRRARPDGLAVTIGAASQTDPARVRETNAQYDLTTFKFVGGVAMESEVLFLNKNFVHALNDKSARRVVVGTVGPTPRSGLFQAFWGEAFLGWNVRWVYGYNSTSELRQALETGEIDMSSFGSVHDIKYLLATTKFATISQTGSVRGVERLPNPLLPNVPIFVNLAKGKINDPMGQKVFDYWNYVSQVGNWLALPPETPEDILAVYVEAFEKTVTDPRYQFAIQKVMPGSPVVRGEDLKKLVDNLATVSPDVLDHIEAMLKR